MGFFDAFTDIWKHSWTWKNVGDSFKAAASDYKNAGASLVGGMWDSVKATLTFDNDLRRQSLNEYMDFGKSLLSGGANSISGITQVPLLKQTFQTWDTLQNEVVRRPLGTASLVGGDFARSFTDRNFKAPSVFDGDTWRQAYNDTRRVSAGQAISYATRTSGVAGIFPLLDGKDPAAIDPRTQQGQDFYHNDTIGKWQSGIWDAGVLFLDPTVVAGKFAVAAKLKYLSKPMHAAAIEGGADKAFIKSARRDELFDFYRNKVDDRDIAHQTIFNKVQGGGIPNSILFDTAKVSDEKLASELFNDSLLYMLGEKDALGRIAAKAPRVARTIGDLGDGAGFGNIAKDFASGNAALDAVVNARKTTDTRAFLDDVANNNSIYGKAFMALVGQPQPRLSVTSKWRVTVHQAVTGSRATFLGPAIKKIGRYGLPSSTFTRIIAFEDPGPTPIEHLRSTWESSRVLPQEELGKNLQRFATATNSEERKAAFRDGEDAIFRAVAAKYNFSPEAVQAAVARINSMRLQQQVAFSQSRRYMSSEIQKVAQALWDEGKVDEAARMGELGAEHAQAVARGETTDAVLVNHIDPEGHTLLLPDPDAPKLAIDGLNKDGSRFNVGESPISPTQHADYAAAMDWRLLHQALWWEKRGPVGQKAYKVIDESRALLDAVSSAWKISMLLRPGYAVRMLTDESGRAMSMMGAGPTFTALANGMANLAQNMFSRGRIVHEEFMQQRAARGLDDTDVVDAHTVEEGAVHTDLAEARPLVENVPDRRERTWPEVAAAVVKRHGRNPDLVSPEIRAIVDSHTTAGTDPTAELATHIETAGLPKGLSRDVKVTKRERKVIQHYGTVNAGLADGLIEPQQYVDAALSAFANRPNSITPDMAAIISDHRFRKTDPSRDLVEHALSQVGRDAFTKPVWRRDFLDNLTESRLQIIDPLTGMVPEKLPTVTMLSEVRRLHPEDELQGFEDYVFNNIDELLKPNSMLHAQVMANGFIELAVAKVDPAEITKLTGGRRVKFRGKEFDYKQTGAGSINIRTPSGTITMDHAFAGAEGDRLRAQVSSRGEGMSWADRMVDKRYQELMQESRDMWRDVQGIEPHYGPSWERVINNQLTNDPVIRKILEGQSDGSIVAWIRKTPEGEQHLKRLGPWQSLYWKQVEAARALVEKYLPNALSGTEAGEALRKAALGHTAEFETHLKPMIPNLNDLPDIHGTAIEAVTMSGKWGRRINKWVDTTFKYIGDLPADRMARFPFTAERMRVHTKNLYDAAMVQEARRGADTVSADVLYRITEMARERTAADAKKYLYDATTSHDMARLARLVVPFGSAAMDSFLKWGVISREKPWVPYNLWKIWTAPDRGGYTTDESGNTKKYINGEWRWVAHDPTTKADRVLPREYVPKQEYVSLQLASDLLPDAVAGKVGDVKFAPRVNKDTFNTFLSLPTAGPLVNVPANYFALDNPEFAEDKLVKRFILPIGSRTNPTDLFLPGWVRTAFSLAVSGPDGNLASSQAMAIYQTEMVKYSLGERPNPPSLEEARGKASDLVGLRMMYQLSGFTPAWVGPYQPYVDYYRQLMAEDPSTADSKFHETAGPEYFALASHVSRNVSGIPATINGYKEYQKYADLIAKFPEVAGLITGRDGGEFSQGVYNWQLEQAQKPGSDKKLRERMTLEESVEDNAIRLGWIKYSKLQALIDSELLDRGLANTQQRGAEDLRDAKKTFLQQNMYWDQSPSGGKQLNPWYIDYSTVDRSRVTARLNGMSQIISDPRLRQRDDIRGLAEYLTNRAKVKQMMEADGVATLQSKEAVQYRAMWDQFIIGLRDRNQSFAQVQDRYLSADQYLETKF